MATKSRGGYVRDASSTDYPYYTYQYWLTPGRIVGIAVGAAVLILIIVAMIIHACRRRRRRAARETTVFSTAPQSYPNPAWRQNDQPLIDASGSPGWYNPLNNATKSSTPTEQVSRTATYGEMQRVPTSDHVHRPASLSEVMRTTVPSQVRRAASPRRVPNAYVTGDPVQEQNVPPPGRSSHSTRSLGPTFPDYTQRTSPQETPGSSFPGRAQSNASTAGTQPTAGLSQEHERRIPPIVPPRHAHPPPDAGIPNIGNQSPPPYSPVLTSPNVEP